MSDDPIDAGATRPDRDSRARDQPDVAGRVTVGDISLVYEQFGRDDDPALLLIMGLGAQLTAWPESFCRALADSGLRVIRFDNRDIGLSSWLDGLHDYHSPLVATIRSLFGMSLRAPYTITDMAEDTRGLMDELGVERAHVVGISMGGMIAQLLAARHPERVLTLTSISSSSGAPELPRARAGMLLRLIKPHRDRSPEAAASRMIKTMRLIGSERYDRGLQAWQREARQTVARSHHPAGQRRQMLAIIAAGSRVALLQSIEQPSLVIHGADDPLLPQAHGRDTARHLRHASYVEIPQMGHELPLELLPQFAELIGELVARSQVAKGKSEETL